MSDPRVLIVGAGPTGLALACSLVRQNVAVRVVDQAAAPSVHSKALAVHARTLEVFAQLGVVDAALAAGHPLHGINVYADGRRIVHAALDQIDSPYPFVLSLPQSETERVLTGELARLGVTVERAMRFTALIEDADGVEVTLQRDGKDERVRVPWVVGCDGAHSEVRHALALPFEGLRYDEPFVLADVTLDCNLPDDEAHSFLSARGILLCLPLPGERRWRLVAEGSASDPPTLAELSAVLAERGPRDAKIVDAQWTASFRVHRRIVQRYRVGRVFLAGDAAHIHSPMGGQGMNTGIQDAFNLAWKLALVVGGAARPELLDSYHAERRPVAAATLSGTDLATRAVTLRNPLARELRDRLASLLSSLEVVQRRVLASASEIGIGYRRSAIVSEYRAPLVDSRLKRAADNERPSVADWFDFGAAPRPGDRVPDVALDEHTHLHALLRGNDHTLLLFDGAAATAEGYRHLRELGSRARAIAHGKLTVRIVVPHKRAPEELLGDLRVLVDPDGALHSRFGAGAECLYLVRPDGYIGFRAQPADGDALCGYLSRLFLPS